MDCMPIISHTIKLYAIFISARVGSPPNHAQATITRVNYIGRFAPSPTGPLHAGSLVAALASYLDARAHGGRWLVRIEDIDEARSVPGAATDMLATLKAFGMQPDGEIVWQSRRKLLYEAAFAQLGTRVYPCGCSRKEIVDSRVGLAADGAAIYPGTCRSGLAADRRPRAWRLRVPDFADPAAIIHFEDRWQGRVEENLATSVGDFVLRRADGFWAYQMAVVVDDADQGVTHVVRGADLLESTTRQIWLQIALNLPTPRYLHVPVVENERGEKLSKQTGAAPIDRHQPLKELLLAANRLGLALQPTPASLPTFWQAAVAAWADRFARARD